MDRTGNAHIDGGAIPFPAAAVADDDREMMKNRLKSRKKGESEETCAHRLFIRNNNISKSDFLRIKPIRGERCRGRPRTSTHGHTITAALVQSNYNNNKLPNGI